MEKNFNALPAILTQNPNNAPPKICLHVFILIGDVSCLQFT